MIRNGEATRARILDAMRQRPGMNKEQLRVATGLAWGTVTYHLLRLHRQGAVNLERRRHEVLCWPVGIPARFKPMLAILQDPDACLILDALAGGRRSVPQIAAKTGLSEPAVRRHLKRMVAANVVRQHGTFRPRFSTDVSPSKPK